MSILKAMVRCGSAVAPGKFEQGFACFLDKEQVMARDSKKAWRWVWGWLLLGVYLCGLTVLWSLKPGIAHEDALMENLQALLLAFGALVSVGAAVLPHRRQMRFVLLTLGLMLFAFLLREMDVEKYDLPVLLVALGSGAGRNLLIAGLGLVLLIVWLKNYRSLWPTIADYLKHDACLWLYLGLGCYLASYLFDKNLLATPEAVGYFPEELCENAATYFLALGAVWTARIKSPGR